jgi:hypothetical protein
MMSYITTKIPNSKQKTKYYHPIEEIPRDYSTHIRPSKFNSILFFLCWMYDCTSSIKFDTVISVFHFQDISLQQKALLIEELKRNEFFRSAIQLSKNPKLTLTLVKECVSGSRYCFLKGGDIVMGSIKGGSSILSFTFNIIFSILILINFGVRESVSVFIFKSFLDWFLNWGVRSFYLLHQLFARARFVLDI